MIDFYNFNQRHKVNSSYKLRVTSYEKLDASFLEQVTKIGATNNNQQTKTNKQKKIKKLCETLCPLWLKL